MRSSIFVAAASVVVTDMVFAANEVSDFVDSWSYAYECSGKQTSSSTEGSNADCFQFCIAEDADGAGGCCFYKSGKSTCQWFSNADGSISIDDASGNAKRVRYLESIDAECTASSGLTIVDDVDDDGVGTRTISALGCSSAQSFDYETYAEAPGGPYPGLAQDYTFEVALPLQEKNDNRLEFVYSISDLGSATGLTLDGVVILAPPTAETDDDAQTQRVYDSCNAHADGSNRYHYHGYPLCLGRDLGADVPDESAWTMFTQVMYDEDYNIDNMTPFVDKWISQWPSTGTPTKLGYMRDGHPIYSPYDDDGNLIKYGSLFDGSDTVTYMQDTYEGVSGWTSPLDACNGYTSESGEYRYVFTPSPPWTISCYKGKKASISYDASTSNCQCPDAGLCYTASDVTEGGGVQCAGATANARSVGGMTLDSSDGDEATQQRIDARLKSIAAKQRAQGTESTCESDDDCNHNEACQCMTMTGRSLLFGSIAKTTTCACKYLD